MRGVSLGAVPGGTMLLIPPMTPAERMGALAEGGAIMPGLGVLYIAATLRRESFPVVILDAEGLGLDLDSTVEQVVWNRPAVLGVTTTTISVTTAAAVARGVKAKLPATKVILGGPHVTALPMETMEAFPQVDGCVLGDGEYSFAQIVRNVCEGKELGNGVDGLVFRDDGDVLLSPKTRHIEDLDSLPFPAWDLLHGFPRIYRPPFHSYQRLPVANIVTSRGCPHVCSFCDRSVFGERTFFHSVEYIVEMIQYLIKDFGIREISIKDDTFVVSSERVVEFCKLLRQRGLNVTWSCNARVNYVNDETIREMKKAGCWMIAYGIESGSPRMLKKMMKGITRKQVMDALSITRRHGIVSKGFFMIGVPGETIQTLEETASFIQRLPLDEININFFTPFPGSRLFQEVLAEGFQPDFARMNMLDAVYVPKGLKDEDLKRYRRKMIYSFYLKPSKVCQYALRMLKDFGEFKRLLRMGKMFFKLSASELRRKSFSSGV